MPKTVQRRWDDYAYVRTHAWLEGGPFFSQRAPDRPPMLVQFLSFNEPYFVTLNTHACICIYNYVGTNEGSACSASVTGRSQPFYGVQEASVLSDKQGEHRTQSPRAQSRAGPGGELFCLS